MFADVEKAVTNSVIGVNSASVIVGGGKVMGARGQRVDSNAAGCAGGIRGATLFFGSLAEISHFTAEKILFVQQADLFKQRGADETDRPGDIIHIVECISLDRLFEMGDIMTAYIPAACIEYPAAVIPDNRADNAEIRLGIHCLHQEVKILFRNSGIVVHQQDTFTSVLESSANTDIIAARITEIAVILDKNDMLTVLLDFFSVRRI
ncbi:hypothetical protein KKHLCK_12460 [Candidatus Electrothrix laxa]